MKFLKLFLLISILISSATILSLKTIRKLAKGEKVRNLLRKLGLIRNCGDMLKPGGSDQREPGERQPTDNSVDSELVRFANQTKDISNQTRFTEIYNTFTEDFKKAHPLEELLKAMEIKNEYTDLTKGSLSKENFCKNEIDKLNQVLKVMENIINVQKTLLKTKKREFTCASNLLTKEQERKHSIVSNFSSLINQFPNSSTLKDAKKMFEKDSDDLTQVEHVLKKLSDFVKCNKKH